MPIPHHLPVVVFPGFTTLAIVVLEVFPNTFVVCSADIVLRIMIIFSHTVHHQPLASSVAFKKPLHLQPGVYFIVIVTWL